MQPFVVSTSPNSFDDNNSVQIELPVESSFFLETGETWTRFYQGYELKVTYVNLEQQNIWLQLTQNGELVEEDILSEGDSLIYKKNSEKIFNITVDGIHIGPDGELVTFNPVYQYQDPTLPPPEVNNDQYNSNMNNDNVNHDNDTIPESGVNGTIFVFSLILMWFLLVNNFKSRK
ncbi:S-layer protein domain-containing protein [Methanosalsum natronophilum]|uniref:S-layer protein domain-containing protein n=1 Tax=Methanosalsum natronophilum TaxID=768733 RepID=UPI002169D1DE|nr:S-layer protein domain-containing protein [Methanosalsum natronophilum]